MHALSFPRIRCKPAKEYVHNYGMHPCDAGGATDPVPSSPISLGLPCCDVLCCAALFLPCLLEQVIRKVISVGALISGANSQLETQPLLNLAAWTIQNRQCVCFGSRERLGLGFGLVFTCFPSTAQLRGSLGWLLRQRQAPRCVLLPSNGGTVTPWSTAAVSKLAPVPSLPAACSPQPAIASPPAHHNLEPHPAARPIRPSQLGRLDPNQLGRQFPSPAATHQPTLCSLTSSSPHSLPPLGSCSVTLCNIRRPTSAPATPSTSARPRSPFICTMSWKLTKSAHYPPSGPPSCAPPALSSRPARTVTAQSVFLASVVCLRRR